MKRFLTRDESNCFLGQKCRLPHKSLHNRLYEAKPNAAASEGHTDVIKMLVVQGADLVCPTRRYRRL